MGDEDLAHFRRQKRPEGTFSGGNGESKDMEGIHVKVRLGSRQREYFGDSRMMKLKAKPSKC